MSVDAGPAQSNSAFAQPDPNPEANTMQDAPFIASAGPSQQDQISSTAKMKHIYHQNRALLDHRENIILWRFPSPTPREIQEHQRHVIGRNFHKACDLIMRHWQVEPAEALPEEMRATTPYSQALLLALRRLASNTKGNREAAQEVLLSVWQDRLNSPSGLSKDETGTGLFQTEAAAFIVNPQGCETHIIESVHGLTLEDVFSTQRTIKAPHKVPKTASSVPAGRLRGSVSKAERAALKEQKKKDRSVKKASRDADVKVRQEDAVRIHEKSRIQKKQERKETSKMRDQISRDNGYKLLQFLQDEDEGGITLEPPGKEVTAGPCGDVPPPNSPEPDTEPGVPERKMRDAMKPRSNVTKVTTPDADAVGEVQLLSGRDHHDYNLLSQMFNRVDMDSKGMGQKKTRKLLDGVSKRTNALPDTKVNFSEIPTLYAQQGLKREEDALEGMEKMKLAGRPAESVGAQDVGAQGVMGNRGVIGYQGVTGFQGVVGIQGAVGPHEWGDGQDGGVKLEDDEEL